MNDELTNQPFNPKTGIINLDDNTGRETHWVAYAIDSRGIIYFDSYGLALPKDFLKYIHGLMTLFGIQRYLRRQ